MKKYTDLFFDLDQTLWDFERAAEETKQELYDTFQLKEKGIPTYELFKNKYLEVNSELWDLYRDNAIEKQELNFKRYNEPLRFFGIDDPQLAQKMADQSIQLISQKNYPFPFATDLLEYLSPKYRLFSITNGFAEVQYPKLAASGFDRYFAYIITSEEAGYKKPTKEMFSYALQKAGARPETSLMIGDDLLADIEGARNSGIDQVFVNLNKTSHSQPVTYEISALNELFQIL